MSLSEDQLAYDDERYRETVFPGKGQDDPKDVLRLVDDYARFQEARQRRGSSAESTDLEAKDATRDKHSLSGPFSELKVDDVVAPFSARRTNPRALKRQKSLTPVSEWEGFVESIDEDEFTLRLVNVRSGDVLADEEAVFPKSELSSHQRARLEIGAIVRWVVGLERLATDQRRRVSELHFRRLPAHTKRDYKRATQAAGRLIAEINWDESTKP